MTSLTEGRHTAEFILSEAEGLRSRDNGTVASGQDLGAGTIVEVSTSKLVAWTGGTIVGIILANVDASGGDTEAAYVSRDAEVNLNLLTYPNDTSAPKSLAISGLASLGIITRE